MTFMQGKASDLSHMDEVQKALLLRISLANAQHVSSAVPNHNYSDIQQCVLGSWGIISLTGEQPSEGDT